VDPGREPLDADDMISPELGVVLYLLIGIFVLVWGQQYAPRSKKEVYVFGYSRVGLAIEVLLMLMLWPIMAMTLAYRFTFGPKDSKDEESDR
jgi:hypothetical protein